MMRKSVIGLMTLLVAIMLLGCGASQNEIPSDHTDTMLDAKSHDTMDQEDDPVDHHMDAHADLDVTDSWNPAPSVTLEVYSDPKAGWNLHIQTQNFEFSPEHASLDHVVGEGHAHIFIDGKKINRVYGNWYHIPSLPTGEHEVRVTLNANSHEELESNGEHMEAFATISVE